jgi:uncharacterized protein YcfJ
MKLKDIFKVALVGTAGWIGGKYGGATGKKIGTALAGSLFSGGAAGGQSGGSMVSPPNLSRFMVRGETSRFAGATDRVPSAENAAQLNSDWEYRLNRYLVRRKYFEDIS